MIYWFPLTKEECEHVRTNGTISKHFHMEISGKVLIVFVGKEKVTPIACEELLRSGICATSIALTDDQIIKIEKGDGIFAQYHDFQVGIISQESLDKLVKNRPLKGHEGLEKEAS